MTTHYYDMLIEGLRALLGPSYPYLRDLFYHVFPVLEVNHRLFGLNLLTALLLAWALYYFARNSGAEGKKGFLSYFFSRQIYLNRSAILDYKYYIVNALFGRLLRFAGVVGISLLVADGVLRALQICFGHLGAAGAAGTATTAERLAYSVAAVLVTDFGYFLCHYLHHKVPVLWQFHKVHHSASVLTPITNYRTHPVEQILELQISSFLLGLTTGLFLYLCNAELTEYTVMDLGVVVFIFNLSANLRHTHVWLSYGRWLSHLFISPAQHQIHHSCEPRHIDVNFGVTFAIWDWLFRSLYVPRSRESFRLGLTGGEEREFASLKDLYFLPFVKAGRTVARARSRRRLPAGATVAQPRAAFGGMAGLGEAPTPDGARRPIQGSD